MFADLWPFMPGQPLGQTEIMSVVVSGQRYTAFIRAQVRAGFKEAARAFTVVVAAEPGASATNAIFKAGAEVEVYATGDLLLRGYVDQKEPHLGPHEATISVTGRSSSMDLIDSDVDHPTGFFEHKDPCEIGAELAQGYGSTFKTDKTLKKLDQHLVTPGESIFRAIEKLARRQGMTLAGTADGNIMITQPDGQRHAGGVIEGQNILVINANHNWSNRHTKYSVKGQRPIGHGSRSLHIVAGATDREVSRHRVKSIIHDDDGDIDDLKKRAENRRSRAAGEALKASVSVQGFRDSGGTVWQPGWVVWTESPFADIAQDMLIEAVDFAQGPEGSISLLSLVDPRAYQGTGAGGGKGDKSGGEWDEDTSPAVDETPAD